MPDVERPDEHPPRSLRRGDDLDGTREERSERRAKGVVRQLRATARRPGAGRAGSATGGERIAALDGLRAIAVALVVAFHFGVPGLQGGFFGVDVFYVLSGYLITGLLLGDHARRGWAWLGTFWMRRARRLLPALLVMLVAVVILVRFAEPAGLFPDFRMSELSALFYFSNWWQIAAQGNYFVLTGAVSPLTHTWSLAIEEQFYLVWPLVVLVVLRLARTYAAGLRILFAVAAAGALASAAEMAALFVPGGDQTRLYFGTDTHAQSILVGAALACGLTIVQQRRGGRGMTVVVHRPVWRRRLTGAGVAGLGTVIGASVLLAGTSSLAYLGGFLAVALASAAVITAVAAVPGGPMARALELRPLRWLGTISYGVYLWHFPIGIVVDSARTGLAGPALFALRVALTLAVAQASYVFIERPVLEGTFWRTMKAAFPAVASVGTVAAAVVVLTAPALPATAGPLDPHVPPATGSPVTAGRGGRHVTRLMIVGDSVAYTMAMGLAKGSVAADGVEVINRSVIGCDLDTVPEIWLHRDLTPSTACVHWKRLWAADLATYHPDVVGLELGWWTTADRVVGGRTVDIAQAAWRAHVEAEYAAAVRLLSSTGAHVVVFTVPYFAAPNAQLNLQLWPEDRRSRVDVLNSMLAHVVAASGGRATLVDLHRILDPAGHFTSTIDGVTVRWPDGIHVTVQGGEWLQHVILPGIARLAHGSGG